MKSKLFIKSSSLTYSIGSIFFLLIIGCSNQELNSNSFSEDTTSIHVISYETPSPSKEGKQVYDTIAHFPKEGEWRKILMIQRIKCDQATKRDKFPCGEWDYSTNTSIFINKNDSTEEQIEINSFVTPYGLRLNLTEDGWEYICDVTDYAPILKGDQRIEHGNNQELHDLKFVFIKGKPSRNVLKVENIWPYGNYKYEDLALNTVLKSKKLPLLKEGKGFRLKARISGHGHFGPYNCCEWDEKIHSYRFSDESVINWNVWKDCGHNPIHPQGGTWQFDRAGWCPGTAIDTYDFEVVSQVENDSLTVDYQIEMFEENGEKDGNYLMSHQLITYGSANFKNDAAILEIITPNNALRYRRNLNINDGTPTIKVRNNGSQIIKNIQFKYGVKGKNNLKYTWYGSLNFLDEQTITLPQLSIKNLDSSVTFYVVIDAVNNNLDEQHLNNYAESIWDLPSYFPNEIILSIKTNDNNRAKENSYIIIDNNSKIIKNRVEFPENTTFSDTLTLNPGIYTWIIKDQKQDGMIRHWWERNSNPDKVGINGEILFKNMVGDTIAAPTYDFADFYSLTFRVK